jgi:hypothetical protein
VYCTTTLYYTVLCCYCYAFTADDVNGNQALRAFVLKHFNTVTDEVYQKWAVQEPNEGIYIPSMNTLYTMYHTVCIYST